jgi:hypothetical protein
MLKYYLWAVGEKALSYFPAGYNGLGYLTTRTLIRQGSWAAAPRTIWFGRLGNSNRQKDDS